jgi:hypothetical protein
MRDVLARHLDTDPPTEALHAAVAAGLAFDPVFREYVLRAEDATELLHDHVWTQICLAQAWVLVNESERRQLEVS